MRDRARAPIGVAVLASLTLLPALVARAAPAMPHVVSPDDGALVASSAVEISGTVDGSTVVVQILESATVLAETGVAGGGFVVEVPLADGPHILLVRPRDANSIAGPDAAVSVTVDTVAPAAPVIVAPAAGDALAHVPITIEGNAEPFGSVAVRDDATGSRFDALADASGNWSVEAALGDGPRTMRATTTDAAGNTGTASAPRSFTIDTRPPSPPTITQPPANARRNVATINVAGIAEPGATVRVDEGTLLSTTPVYGDATWQTSLTFTEGDHTITVSQSDAAGHVSSQVTRRFTIDLTAPVPPVILTPLQAAVVGPANVVVTGRAEPLSAITVQRGGVQIATALTATDGNWFAVIQAPAGDNEIRARARDLAGNTGAFSPLRTFTVDATPPELTITSASGQIVLPWQTPRIEGTAVDGFAVDRIDLGFYDVLGRGVASYRAICPQCPVGDEVTWRNDRSPDIGRFVVKVYAVDHVGNRSPEQEVVITIVRPPL
jgi:hypothetical protein